MATTHFTVFFVGHQTFFLASPCESVAGKTNLHPFSLSFPPFSTYPLVAYLYLITSAWPRWWRNGPSDANIAFAPLFRSRGHRLNYLVMPPSRFPSHVLGPSGSRIHHGYQNYPSNSPPALHQGMEWCKRTLHLTTPYMDVPISRSCHAVKAQGVPPRFLPFHDLPLRRWATF